MADGIRRVAAFDFDGTITQRDTLAGFLSHVGGPRALTASMAAEANGLARGLRDDAERDAAKERVLGRVLAGRTEEEVTAAGLSYAKLLPRRFRVDIAEKIRWHQRQSHELVIVSASLVYYLRPVAAELGFHDVLGVEMEVGPDGRLTGKLAGANVRAAEKERRLRAWLGTDHDGGLELWAYGNSSGDDHLLAMAHHPTWVGKRAKRNA